MSIRSVLLVPLLAGCQAKAEQPAPAAPMIEVHDGTSVIASVRIGKPCRATIGPTEMIVGGPPLVSQLGEIRWTGSDGSNGTALARDGVRVARVYPAMDPASAAVFDPVGAALMRVHTDGNKATVSDTASHLLRTLARAGAKITVDHPALTITGTNDLVLASMLSAPELDPEIRMLTACERVLVTEKKEL